MFDETKPEWDPERAQLRALLDDDAWAQARRTTVNAHYTDPQIAAAIWEALSRLGFQDGLVLEPGSGSGTFIGTAPDGASMVGVELDATTAAIARGLYPHARVLTESFADSSFPRGHFDAAVGNVPFADVVLHDPAHNRGGHSLHNHFILKSLALTKPGGIVAVLTSHYTLDAANPAARREMSAMADLLGAVRLPTGAHRRSAGTEAVTDLLILRRREPGRSPADHTWEGVVPRIVDGERVKVNAYFDVRPEHLLGELHVGIGMHGAPTLLVRADLDALPGSISTALTDIADRANAAGLSFAPAEAETVAQRAARVDERTHLWDGTILAEPDGTFRVVADGYPTGFDVPRTQAAELRALLGLRDGARELLESEAATLDDTADLAAQRQRLLDSYQRYVARYGPVNRFTQRPTGRTDPETGEPQMARIRPRAAVLLRRDPFGPLTMALERYDEETGQAAPAALLRQRVVAPRHVAQGAETAADAVALSLDRTGGIDLPLIADLLGVDPDDARAQLGTLVYDDPATGTLAHAPEYLSGNVRIKLQQARDAAENDERYLPNVEALEQALPAPIGLEDIRARLGAVWISADIHQQFLRDILRDRRLTVENPLPGEWVVRGEKWGLRATEEYGTPRKPAPEIAEALMEQREVLVYDQVETAEGKKRSVLNPDESTAAQVKADQMQERFAEWVWEEPERAAALAAEYNARFNSLVLRDYSDAGEHLSLPGLAAGFTPRPHQRAAVARMVAEPAVGLFHQVGAGKTAEMVMGTMELRRMGLVSKPAVIVPNHMLEQFSREWLGLYPTARILAASTRDIAGDDRRLFVARAAANEWDAIVMTQSAFERIPVSDDYRERYVSEQVSGLRHALEAARESGATASSVKRIEKAVMRAEESHKRLLAAPKDPGISFEAMGIDYLVVDEAHMYKNLKTVSSIGDATIEGSNKATDLHMKTEYLRRTHGSRVITAATATPLANSVTEAHVMQRYLRPDLLEQAGVLSFDAWAATFGRTVTDMEMGPAGGFRTKTRFAAFQNVGEMLRMWHVFADVKTAEDLNLPVPLIRARPDGQRAAETVVVPPTPQVEAYIQNIAERAELVAGRRVDPREDNMLRISTDGRAAALDIRLVQPGATPYGTTKLDIVAHRILTEWAATQGNEYIDQVTGEPSPIRGGLQLVFSDLGTPSETRWSAYEELRRQLAAGGIPENSIRFIHEAKNDADKGRLFAAARAGHISVLMGSTGKMGVGTNVQDRLTAMHHVDCPWRPADIEQRDGRGIRQGNQNPEVAVFRYVVERSFDAYSWQTVARKATFINQIMRGKIDAREIEDIGDSALSAAEAKALASGNPLILEKANADSELQKLRRQETAHHRAQNVLAHTRTRARETVTANEQTIAQLRAARERTTDVSGDNFAMTIKGRTYTARADAADALGQAVAAEGVQFWDHRRPRRVAIGAIAGHDVLLETQEPINMLDRASDIRISLDGVPLSGARHKPGDVLHGGLGLIRQIENKTTGIDRSIARLEQETRDAEQSITDAEARMGAPFKHADQLAAAYARADDISARLAEQLRRDQQATAAAAAPGPAADGAGSEPGTGDAEARAREAIRIATAGHQPPRAPGGVHPQARHERRDEQPQPGRDAGR